MITSLADQVLPCADPVSIQSCGAGYFPTWRTKYRVRPTHAVLYSVRQTRYSVSQIRNTDQQTRYALRHE